jgi:hypothetical protein
MPGLTERAGGDAGSSEGWLEASQQAWEESMTRRLEDLRRVLRDRNLTHLATLTGSRLHEETLELDYWNRTIQVAWPALTASFADNGDPCSTFDNAMLMYYLSTADGTPLADRWIGFRELPDGAFYNQAFQGYSGNLLALRFGEQPHGMQEAASLLAGDRLPALAPVAYAFQPLPRIRLAAVLWPGDDEFAARASILFDAASHHYMTTDGLALLGSGLARRLLRAAPAGT